MSEDIIRILRVIEYTGPRSHVERQVANSIHGTKTYGPHGSITISAATIGEFPEILGRTEDKELEPVPNGVYYDTEREHFYNINDHVVKNLEFQETWFDRRHEFPTQLSFGPKDD